MCTPASTSEVHSILVSGACPPLPFLHSHLPMMTFPLGIDGENTPLHTKHSSRRARSNVSADISPLGYTVCRSFPLYVMHSSSQILEKQ